MKATSFLLKLFLFLLVFVLLTILDGIFGVHVFFVGGLMTLLLLMPLEYVVYCSGAMSFFYDVRFHFPLGTIFLILMPVFVFYPMLTRFFHSRMAAFGIQFFLSSLLLSFIEKKQTLQFSEVIWTLVLVFLWTVGVYLYVFRSKYTRIFNSKQSRLRFS